MINLSLSIVKVKNRDQWKAALFDFLKTLHWQYPELKETSQSHNTLQFLHTMRNKLVWTVSSKPHSECNFISTQQELLQKKDRSKEM